MRIPIRPIHGLSALACTAAMAGMLLLTFSDSGRAEETAAQVADQAPDAAPDPTPPAKTPVAPGEYVSPPAAESEWRIGNLSVIELMEGALAARERNDLAYLARCMESCSEKPALVEDDLLAAHRHFKWRSTDPGWAKITQSWLERSYEVVEEGDSAELVMQVGGSLGEMRLRFTRKGSNWFFAGI